MSRVCLRLAAMGFVYLCISPPARAQLPPELEQGLKDFESYHGGAVDNINMATGNITLDIPLFSIPQRGHHLTVNYRIFHNNKQFIRLEHCGGSGGCSSSYHWRGGSSVYVADVGEPLNFSTGNAFCLINGIQTLEHYALVTEADGAQHNMLFSTALNGYESIDASAYHFDSTKNVLTDRAGTRNKVGTAEDTNGNEITFGSTISDTLGRVLQAAGTPDTSACPSGTTSSSAWAMPGFNGASATYTFCYATTALKTHFADADAEYSGNQSLLVGVVLPNGQRWQFQYGPSPGDPSGVNYGDLIQITFPTGGTISYTYANRAGATQSSRWVTSRTVNAADTNDDPGGAHTWTYNWQLIVGGASVNQMRDPLGNDTLYTPGPYQAYIQTIQHYSGAYTAGNVLETVSTTYTSNSSQAWIGCGWEPYDVVATAVTATWPDGKKAQVQTDYDAGFAYTDFGNGNYTATFGNVIAKREYDWGASTPTRQTLTNYQALYSGAPNHASYLANHILDIPYSVQVLDGSGVQKAYTYFTYDTSTPLASGITTQHDSNPPAGAYRGNQMAVNRWLNTTGGYLSSTATVYDTGMVSVAKDPLLNPTTFSYSSSFAGGYPTTVTNSLNQNMSYNYDFNIGLRTSVTDLNNQTTSYTYDLMKRSLRSITRTGAKRPLPLTTLLARSRSSSPRKSIPVET